MDLVLINPNSREQAYQSLGKTLAAVEPPIWAGLMAAFVRKHGFEVAIIDAEAEQLSHDETAKRAVAMKPRLIGIVVYGHNPNASTQVMPDALAVCELLVGGSAANVMLLGGHVAALPEQSVKESEAVVAGGEGLWTLVDTLRKENPIRGLYEMTEFREKVWHGPSAPLVETSDMPMPAWDLLPMHLYRAHNWQCFGGRNRQPYAAIYTTLSCPFACSFCSIQAPFREGEKASGRTTNSYRYWSPEVVCNTLEELHTKYGVRNVKIADEMFVLNRRHVEAICDGIVERRLDLNIWAYARIDTAKDAKLLAKMKLAGFNWLGFGIESADADVRDGVAKGYKQSLIYETLDKVRDAGIHIAANYIFGLPGDTESTMQATLDMACDLNTEWVNFNCAMAYPGSPLYEQAVREGWELPASWSGYAQHSKDSHPLPTKHLTSQEVLRFRDNAFRVYFQRPEYLEMMCRKFGEGAVHEVEQMLQVRLEREAK